MPHATYRVVIPLRSAGSRTTRTLPDSYKFKPGQNNKIDCDIRTELPKVAKLKENSHLFFQRTLLYIIVYTYVGIPCLPT